MGYTGKTERGLDGRVRKMLQGNSGVAYIHVQDKDTLVATWQCVHGGLANSGKGKRELLLYNNGRLQVPSENSDFNKVFTEHHVTHGPSEKKRIEGGL